MERAASDLRARCGTVDDLTNLVSIYVQLGASAKGALWGDVMAAVARHRVKDVKTADGKRVDAAHWLAALADTGHPDWDQCAHLIVRIRRLMAVGLSGSATEITTLMEVYRWLFVWTAGDWSVLVEAAKALALARVQGLVDANDDAVEVEDWLHDLAEEAYPRGELVSGLLGSARDGGLDLDDVFTDGRLEVVLCDQAAAPARGEGMYDSYEAAISMLSAYQRPATAKEFFGIDVDKAEYRTFGGEEWILDEDAQRAEVDRRCAERFIEFVGYWRSSFFDALISGKQPEAGDR